MAGNNRSLRLGRVALTAMCAAGMFAFVGAGVPAAAEDVAKPAAAAPAGEKSLYERIGGYKAVAAASDDLVDRIYVNATLNKNPALKAVHDLNERAAFKLILSIGTAMVFFHFAL